jgi:hypothetical protein
MSKKTSDEGYNGLYSINDLDLTDEQKEQVLEYLAQKYWHLLRDLGIQDGHCKSYDPLMIEGNIAYSYVFDLEDGGRQHSFDSYEHLEKMLTAEILASIKGEHALIDPAGELKAKNLR